MVARVQFALGAIAIVCGAAVAPPACATEAVFEPRWLPAIAATAATDTEPLTLADDAIGALDRIGGIPELIAIGEAHDNPVHHAIQARVLDRLVARGERPILALEMLTEDQQDAIDEGIPAGASVEDLDRRLAWSARGWPDFRMYYPLFETARRHGLAVLAADLTPATTRAISRSGLRGLPAAEQGRLASRLPADPAREEALRRTIERAHCDLLPPDASPTMAEAWHARNVTMARRVAEALGRARTVVLIVGRAHLAPDGVPGQLEALRPGTRIHIIDLIEATSPDPLPNASVALTTTTVTRPDRCAELRKHWRRWHERSNGPRPADPARGLVSAP
jgi:uncharacterized iron-regulated protein